MLDDLNPLMQQFIARQEMAFISTADVTGHCNCSFRAGAQGFVQVLDE
jgi:predicted pyridoxine 5'-phosphate oxidase superfamily flavin-nucleotide-binding protein